MKKIINEQLCVTTTNPLKIRNYDYDRFTYPWHIHKEYEMLYVDHGTGKCVIGNNILDYRDHTLFFFGSSLPHWMQSDAAYENDESLRVSGTIIQFEKDFMQYSFSNYIQFKSIHELLESAGRGMKFDLEGHLQLQIYLKNIASLEGVDQIICILQILKELSSTNKTLAASADYRVTLAGIKDNKIEKVLNYINANYTRHLTLDQIAAYAAMNTSAFSRYFKEKTGKTVKGYILEMRINYACHLLAAGRMNISQISLESGFDTLSFFNRTFKRLKGYTPTQYKKIIDR